MKNGKIHQLDYINNVFSKPKDKFVADFVGVHNIFEGQIKDIEKNNINVKINDELILYCANEEYYNLNKGDENKKVLIALRPENIIFANEKFESSARNQIKGTVINITESGPIITIETDVKGVKFTGILTKNSYESLKIKKGKEIYLIFKSVNVNVLDSYNTFNLQEN
jgi:molybdopterin-binding protein